MKDHISILQGYIDHLEYMKKNAYELFDREQADKDIESFKAAIQALEEQKTGHWIEIVEKSAICSCCSRNNVLFGDFCKWCGAKMVIPQGRSDKE